VELLGIKAFFTAEDEKQECHREERSDVAISWRTITDVPGLLRRYRSSQ
jgi:hypothetical protein